MKFSKKSKLIMKYALIISLIISIILLSSNKIEKYTNEFLDQMIKIEKSTKLDDEGEGNVMFLDRHKVNCNGLMTKFRLGRDGKKYQYKYKCLDVNPKSSKLVITGTKQTTKIKTTGKSYDLINQEIDCYDPNDQDVGLVSFVLKNGNGESWYDYTCGKHVMKTKEELKSDKEKEDKKKAEEKRIKDEKEKKEKERLKKINDSKPTKPGCYVYTDQSCVANQNLVGKWHHDQYGERYEGAGESEKQCTKRIGKYNDYCKSNDFINHFNKFPGFKTKKYSQGEGNTVYLDGHNIDCGDQFLTSVVLKPVDKDKYSYHYQCSNDITKITDIGYRK
tara:strand:+ start:376 stop:1374 length:999 start_codon:yes stop_codon:yes gene_type:complete